MAQTKAERTQYNINYRKEHVRQVKLDLSYEHDADILTWLDAQKNRTGYLKNLIRADIARAQNLKSEGNRKMYKINFEAGTSRHGSIGVNLMVCTADPDLYAEIAVPDDASEDYGYLNLKDEILRRAAKKNIPADSLEFWYDGQEDKLEPDARV